MPKRRKVGRPKLPKGQAKGRIVPVRFDDEDLRLMTAAAKSEDWGLSDWIRHTLRTAAEGRMFGMTLHDAMKTVLMNRHNQTASTEEIADEIEKAGLYRRKDGGSPAKHQVYSRARKYPQLFALTDPQTVQLIGNFTANQEQI